MFEIRTALATDIPRLTGIDHSCMSDYVWQLELRREQMQTVASFREVRLPRTVKIEYPRNPASLVDEWSKHDVMFAVLSDDNLAGYACVNQQRSAAVATLTDIVVAPLWRRKGAAAALLTATQAWALERGVRRLILEMQSKNNPAIRFAQKLGYEFCGYNDQYYPTQDVALFFGRALK